jgi:death-on-curing protein
LELKTLTPDEVLTIYEILVRDFAESGDPLAPAGVRSQSLLESAVSRQHTGIGGRLKYPDPFRNAASLAFGLCMDHAFHNGNKRCALVAMLVHLDRNKHTLYGCNEKDLYGVMLDLAKGILSLSSHERRRESPPKAAADDEVEALARWLSARAGKLSRGERRVTYRQLRRILKHHEYDFGEIQGNSIAVLRRRETVVFFIKKKRWTRIGTIGYHDEGTFVAMKELKRLRTMCRLREEDGVDSESFYDMEESVDAFVNQYRTVLRRLGRT